MIRFLIVFYIFIKSTVVLADKDIKDLLSSDDLREIQEIIVSTIASCADKIVTDQSDLGFAAREIARMQAGIVEVIAESLLTLALKKDYPNACHVLPKDILEKIEVTQNSKKRCLWKTRWGCALEEKQEWPVYSYYWPKYFIEVTQKGNDSLPAFSSNNLLYSASRKFAFSLDNLVNPLGPYKLVAKVVGAAVAIKGATSSLIGQGMDFHVDGNEIEQGAKTAVLTPFEKLRIRANTDPDMPSFEVNIWPVGLSNTIAKNLTVCEQGGFQWSVPAVPMTCPVAMSRDAWGYWDSGMLDYLNPNAIRGITAASNPIACVTDNLAGNHFDKIEPKDHTGTTEGAEDKLKKDGMFSNLPNSYRGLGMCSFPILGDAEAIASQTIGLKNSFKGPWCTLWGPIVPRMSTPVQITDYSYPNAALKFKLLAHDLFGIPRGAEERWTLAFPWEEKLASSALGFLDQLTQFLDGGGFDSADKDVGSGSYAGRSKRLMPPGDPLLIDAFNANDLAINAKNLAREVLYLAGLNTAASEVDRRVLKAFAQETGQTKLNQQQILDEQRKAALKAVDETARLGEEPVFEKRVYCRIEGEKQGYFTKKQSSFDIPGVGNHSYELSNSVGQCHQQKSGKCLNRHRVSRKCLRPESIFYVSYEKWEIARYVKVQHPRRFVVRGAKCSFNHNRDHHHTHNKHHYCSEELVPSGREDTSEHIELPDHHDPEKTMGKGSDAGKQAALAARVATWVGTEIARAKYENISGRSVLPGKKRVYTIFEKIQCEPKTKDGRDIYRKKIPGGAVWSSCSDAVNLQIRQYFQRKLLRRTCDHIFNYKLGEPFK